MPVFGDGKNFQFLVQSFTPACGGEEGGGEGEEGEGRGEGGVDGGEGGVGGVGGGGEHDRYEPWIGALKEHLKSLTTRVQPRAGGATAWHKLF